jgi:hypothetical protein
MSGGKSCQQGRTQGPRATTRGAKKQIRGFPARFSGCVILAVLFGTAILAGGCHTPYTQRIMELDDAYQRGELSREDYLRFANEAENWEGRWRRSAWK